MNNDLIVKLAKEFEEIQKSYAPLREGICARITSKLPEGWSIHYAGAGFNTSLQKDGKERAMMIPLHATKAGRHADKESNRLFLLCVEQINKFSDS